jgi:hypothetical protein
MMDRKISALGTLAYALWAASFTLVIVALVTPVKLGQLGLLLAGVAMVLNIRGFFCALHRREHAAYELGVESGRALHLQR